MRHPFTAGGSKIDGLENLVCFLNCSAARDSSNLLAHEPVFIGQQDAEPIPWLIYSASLQLHLPRIKSFIFFQESLLAVSISTCSGI
jgi:hypothetical protein